MVLSASLFLGMLASCGSQDPASSSDAGPDGSSLPGSGTWVSGYYAGYQRDMYPPAAVDFSGMTHLMMAAALPRANGTLDTAFYIDNVNGPALARDLASRAHAAGKKAILMIGGAGAQAGWQGAASSTNRAAFVQNLLDAIQNLGYDGLDLDWEPVAETDKPMLLALAQDLRARSPAILLTLPVGWLNSNDGGDAYYATLAPYLDQMNIMSYEMADAWPGWQAWHSQALAGEGGTTPSSVSSSANGWAAAGIPKAKIGIGLGFYGACWKGPTAPHQPTGMGVVASDNVMTYAHVMASYYAPAAYHWDATASASYLSFSPGAGPEGCTFVSYDDPAAITAKGAWVRANGFGGAIIWTVNQGYIATSGTNPPLDAVKAAFLP